MGTCCASFASDEDTYQNHVLSKELARDKQVFGKVKKILFLGSGGSGKSTIAKQLRVIYKRPFTLQERQAFVLHIHEQVITQMKLALDALEEYLNDDMDGLIKQNERLYNSHTHRHESKESITEEKDEEEEVVVADDDDTDDDDDDGPPELSERGQEAKHYLESVQFHTYDHALTHELVDALKKLWKEPAIKRMYAMRNITKIEDSSAYFWDKLDELNTPNYVPDQADIVLVRNKTAGATERKFDMPDGKGSFSIIDVGGQKSERKKWIKCFEGVTAVIFVASLSCYDEVLYEDYSTNSMTDQLELFDDVCNNPALSETSMILFLNKKDIFQDKIKRVSIAKCESLQDFEGATTSFDQTTKYIRRAFTSLNNEPNRKNIFTHLTCAADTDSIQKVFIDVQQIVIEASLVQAGLMDLGGGGDDGDAHAHNGHHHHSFGGGGGGNESQTVQYDPHTAAKIRDTIQKSGRQKSGRPSQQHYPLLYSSSVVSGMSPHHNFREIIKKKSVPPMDALDYVSIFTQYEFDWNDHNWVKLKSSGDADDDYLDANYCWAQCAPEKHAAHKKKNSKQSETFVLLSIEPNYERHAALARTPRINLCLVLDVGRAMDGTFTDGENKMAATLKCLLAIVRALRDEDRLCIVLFDMNTKVLLEFDAMRNLDVDALCAQISALRCEQQSLESMRVVAAAYKVGVNQYKKLLLLANDDGDDSSAHMHENRILMITTSRLCEEIFSSAQAMADKRIYSTFVGVCNRFSLQRGLLSEIRGCNYFSVESSEQLYDKMVTRFDEIVTPLLFDVRVALDEHAHIAAVWRINEDQYDEEYKYLRAKHKQQILQLNTLFLTRRKYDDDDDNCANKRYLLLIKLASIEHYNVAVHMTWQHNQHNNNNTNASGSLSAEILLQKTTQSSSPSSVEEEDGNNQNQKPLLNGSAAATQRGADYFDNHSIHKAVLLSRYVSVLREWAASNNAQHAPALHQHHQHQQHHSHHHAQRVQQFVEYFKREAQCIDDMKLEQEINVLHSMLNAQY